MKFVKTNLLTKLLLLGLAVYAVITLVSLQSQVRVKKAEATALEEKVMYAEQERLQLEEDLENINTDAGIVKIARERLGMVAEGEIVFFDSDN